MAKTQTAEARPFAIGDQIEWDGEDGTKHTGQVRSMGDPGVTTDNAWLPWNTKGLRKAESVPESEFTRVNQTLEPAGHRLLTIPLDQVQPSPQNPRGQASMGDLQALANDIRTNGQINPITVRQLDSVHFEVITGERRFRACALAELPTILAINRGPISLEEALVERVRENAQREQLTPLEEAKAIEFLLSAGKSPTEAATIMGKSEAWVSLTRTLGRMPGEAQDLLAKGRISRSVAEALFPLMLWPKVLVDYARHAVSQGWSSRTVQTEVAAKVEALKREEERRNSPPEVTVTTTTTRKETTKPRINFDDDDDEDDLEPTDIRAGERTAQEALANEPEAPIVYPDFKASLVDLGPVCAKTLRALSKAYPVGPDGKMKGKQDEGGTLADDIFVACGTESRVYAWTRTGDVIELSTSERWAPWPEGARLKGPKDLLAKVQEANKLTEEEIAAAKAKQENKDALNETYTQVCDALWGAICEAVEQGVECKLLSAVEACIRDFAAPDVEFTVNGADEETDE